MTPREVIARAINLSNDWDLLPRFMQEQCLVRADAVIDALEGMEVTEGMEDAAYNWAAPEEHAVVLWRAMVGAMRDE